MTTPQATPSTLETKFIELPTITLPPLGTQAIPISFAQPAKIVEIPRARGVKLVRVKVGDKSFEGESYVNEVVPPGVPVMVEIENERTEETRARTGMYVEQEAAAPVPQAAPAPAVAAAPAAAAPPAIAPPQGVPLAGGTEHFVPPPPGQVRQYSLPGQQITVTTPAPGANGGPAAGAGAQPFVPGMQPPPAGTVQSFDLGNQKVTVTTPAKHAHPASQVIAAVIQPRVAEGPTHVICGTDEVAILVKRSEAENMLAILRGAILHPGYCVPLEGAVRRALGEP